MPKNYCAELETALLDAFREDFESELEAPGPKPNNPQLQPGGALARGLYAKYQTACKGRRTLKVLRKRKLDPIDEALMLEDRIQRLPLLFQKLAVLKQARGISPVEHQRIYNRLVTTLGYPPGIYLGTLDDALAQARCDLTESRWRAVAPGRRINP
jgi:hypothetical protein